MSAAVAAASFHGVTSTFSALATVARRSASVGTVSPSFFGEVARITRLDPPNSALPSEVTSVAEIPGSSDCTSFRSCSIPGLGSPSRK